MKQKKKKEKVKEKEPKIRKNADKFAKLKELVKKKASSKEDKRLLGSFFP